MEVEKIQDGPLKNNEIVRFLEASKTSYKSVESILSKRKENSFQQRTLLEIASESELRLKSVESEAPREIEEQSQLQIETDKKQLEDEAEAQKQKKEEEAESLKILEQKKITDSLAAEETKDKEIYDRGFLDGKNALESEASDKLENALLALENARKSILDLNATHFIKLRDDISSRILGLASSRAGLEITELPEVFFKKIESLIESVGQKTQSPKIYLNPKDLDAIQGVITKEDTSSGFIFESKEDLIRGDIIIEIGSISIADTAANRSNLSVEDVSIDINTETTKTDKATKDLTHPQNQTKNKEDGAER